MNKSKLVIEKLQGMKYNSAADTNENGIAESMSTMDNPRAQKFIVHKIAEVRVSKDCFFILVDECQKVADSSNDLFLEK